MTFKGYWGKRESGEQVTINSCGHVFTYNGREINRPRGRSDYLLLYIYRGSARFFFGKSEYVCNSGDLVLYAPHEPQHHIYKSNLSGEFYYIHFSADDTDFAGQLGMQSSTPYSTVPSSALCDIFEEILTELQQKNNGYKTVCVSLATQLFVKINRLISQSEGAKGSSEISSVIQHISNFYADNTSLDEYAKMCGLSKYHFIREFEKIAHMPPVKYRNKIRLSHAKEMLANTSIDVKIIAEKLGYSSASYFCEAFKASEGMSPREYRIISKNQL